MASRVPVTHACGHRRRLGRGQRKTRRPVSGFCGAPLGRSVHCRSRAGTAPPACSRQPVVRHVVRLLGRYGDACGAPVVRLCSCGAQTFANAARMRSEEPAATDTRSARSASSRDVGHATLPPSSKKDAAGEGGSDGGGPAAPSPPARSCIDCSEGCTAVSDGRRRHADTATALPPPPLQEGRQADGPRGTSDDSKLPAVSKPAWRPW